MSWFDKLKEFVKIDIHIHDVIKINIKSNDSSERFDYNEGEKALSINLDKLTGVEKGEFGQIVRESVSEDITLLGQKPKELIEDIKLKEKSEDVQALLGYFKDKIPSDDFAALRSAVYIKKLFDERASPEVIYDLKGDVIKKYGKRGLNICNLCSSGYFDTMIKPLYDEISNEGFDKNVFLDNYNVIINEEAFAVFVSGDKSKSELKNIIERKINRNLSYGRRDVTIHGIGISNVVKIKEAISDIEKKYPIITKDIEEKGHIILAKLFF